MWETGENITSQALALFKKKQGTVYLTNKRLAWVQQSALAPTVSIKHDDIKSLFVNAATADKVILKIVEIKPDVSHSFYFSSESASKDRDEFKAGISSILSLRQQRAMNGGATPSYSGAAPSPGGGGSPVISDASAPGTPKAQAKLVGMKRGLNGGGPPQELKTRFALLKQNKELAGLHRDLVMGKHVSEEEFWESRKHLLRNKIAMDGQQKGQSSAWLDLKPETGESNDVKYVMTPQVIHSVCQQYPSIKRAYDAYVPDKLSEAEFWKRYFQSRFFHRSRSGRGANEPDDEIFDKALEEDEEETKSAPKRIKLDHINKLVDLSTTEEDHLESYTSPESTMAAGRTKESKEAMPLIRRFNRYAQRVLNSTVGPKKPTKDDTFDMNGVERAIVFEDLQEQQESSRIVLDIQDTRRYFESQGGDVRSSKIQEGQNPATILQKFYNEFTSQGVELNKPFSIPDTTFGTLMKNVKANRAKMSPPKDGSQVLPAQLYQEAIACHSAGNEILRHFWASTGVDKAIKHQRMVESLKKIQDENVKSLLIQANSLGIESLNAMRMMLKPMQNGIEKALKHAASRPKPPVRKIA
ncbi:RNA polymerase II transcription factor B subunit 1 [Podila epicladia]|nr:RNA polymerase II transcription factor B subunit 1 [Podila epicladia]